MLYEKVRKVTDLSVRLINSFPCTPLYSKSTIVLESILRKQETIRP